MFLGEAGERGHRESSLGAWRGLFTAGMNPSDNMKGALTEARDVLFEKPLPGRGSQAVGRVREGRENYLSTAFSRRFSLAPFQAEEQADYAVTGLTTLSTDAAKYGYFSAKTTTGGSTNSIMRNFDALDVAQGTLSNKLSDWNLTMWVKTDVPADVDPSEFVAISSDSGTPAWTYTNYLYVPLSAFTPSITSISANTWTKLTVNLAHASILEYGDFAGTAAQIAQALGNITSMYMQMFSLTGTVYVADVALESSKEAHVIKMGAFKSPTEGDDYLFVKTNESLWVDKNEALSFDKIVSALGDNLPASIVQVYNQMFYTDGLKQYVVDLTQNSLGAYNYRTVGFPAPSAGSIAVSATSGGTESSAGTHNIFIANIYGNASAEFGVSNITYLGNVTIGASQKYSITGITAATEKEGVVKRRIFIGLAGDPKRATCYKAADIDASTTSTTIDISDVDLAGLQNPIGPVDHDIPPIAEMLIPFDGSLIYLGLAENKAAAAYSRIGSDFTAGPEVVPDTNRLVNRLGEAWTGGISRGGLLYLFTRNSIHVAQFLSNGYLDIQQLSQSITGASTAVGALGNDSIMLDADGNIIFESAKGTVLLDIGNRVHMLGQTALYDEWKQVNTEKPVGNYRYRTFTTEAQFEEGTLGDNLDAPTDGGAVEYQYPNVDYETTFVTPSFGTAATIGAFYNGTLFPVSNDGYLNCEIEAGEKVAWCCKANNALYLTGITFQMLATAGATLVIRTRKYVYELDPERAKEADERNASLIGDTVGATVTSVTAGSPQPLYNIKTVTVSSGSISTYIPKGELFWIEIENASGGPVYIIQGDNGRATSDANLTLYTGWYEGPEGTGGKFPISNGSEWRSASLRVTYAPVQDVVHDVEITHSDDTVQRYAMLARSGYGDTWGDILKAAGQAVFECEAFDADGNGTGFQDLVRLDYSDPSDTPVNSVINFWNVLPDYRPDESATYPNRIDRPVFRIRMRFSNNSPYGEDIVDESQSKISTAYYDTFHVQNFTIGVKYSSETYSGISEPYPNDVWTSPAIDMGSTPAAWGAFSMIADEAQQRIYYEARTDSVDDFSGNPTWYGVSPNSIPTLSALPINGKYLQIRAVFKDDPSKTAGIPSALKHFGVAWQPAGTLQSPMLPPAAAYFDGVGLIAHALPGAQLNTQAWCLSYGGTYTELDRKHKLSIWTNQTVNCWCVYKDKLLAGRCSNGMISWYGNKNTLDDGARAIRGKITTAISHLGITDAVKMLQGLKVYTGVREYRGVPTSGNDLVSGSLVCSLSVIQASLDAPYYEGHYGERPEAYIIQTFLFNYGQKCASGPRPNISLADFFSTSTGPAQEQFFQFSWEAYAHSVYNRNIASRFQPTAFARFPYLADIIAMFYVESYNLGDVN